MFIDQIKAWFSRSPADTGAEPENSDPGLAPRPKPKIGLALGGGGVRGLAHVPLLKVFDELGIKPDYIAGTSMGAIIGALYAGGMSGAEIEDRVKQQISHKSGGLKGIASKSRRLIRWVRAFGPDFGGGGLVTADGIFEHLITEIQAMSFETMRIPYRAVACDFWTGDVVVLESGSVLKSVQASMAVPGVFAPVRYEDKLLVDGGLVNNLPFDLFSGDVDVSVAFELTNLPEAMEDQSPSVLDIAMGALDIMQVDQLRKRLEVRQPDILIRPVIKSVGLFDFHKIETVIQSGEQAAHELKLALQQRVLNEP